MRKIILGLALFMGLVFMEASELTQDEIKEFSEKCDKGDIEACFNLGVIYANGYGVQKNYQKALKFHTQACDKGFAEACDNQRILEGELQ